MRTGEPENGANIASGVNVNGAARNGVNTSGASVNGGDIETTPGGATSKNPTSEYLCLNES
jgi:hypothetical protein